MLTFAAQLLLVLSTLTRFFETESIHCTNAVPGASVLVLGVDIAKFDLHPINSEQTTGLKRPVISEKCKEGRVLTRNVTKYNVPLAVLEFVPIGAGTRSSSVKMYSSYHSVKKDMARTIGVKANFGLFAFSASTTYKTMQNKTMKDKSTIMFINTKQMAHKIYLAPIDKNMLDEGFEYNLGNLKGKKYISNRRDFEEFIEYYGTHHFTEGTFGGMIRQYFESSSKYTSTKSVRELERQVKASYNGILNKVVGFAKYNNKQTKVDQKFIEETERKIEYYGGTTNLLKKGGLTKWQPTVDSNPTLMSSKVKPLYELVFDDAPLREQLKIAIDQYLIGHFLDEMSNKLHNARFGFDQMGFLRNKISDIRAPTIKIYNITAVKALNDEIVYNTEIPDWFLENTQICFKFGSKEKGSNQCNHRQYETTTPTTFCARTGSYTEKYSDDGSRDDENCLLQWGITSIGADDWFDKVEICMKYTGTKSGEKCARVNEFTSKFEDDTRDGVSYNYQWMIKVNNAPIWFQRTKFCLMWETYGRAVDEQCSANGKTLCATPGNWTGVYTDKTKDFYGGCIMKWAWLLMEDNNSPFNN